MKKRTLTQNKALHVGFRLLADELNNAGLPIQKMIRVDLDWNTWSVKEYLFKPFLKAMYGKDSTTQLDKHLEIDEVWNTLMRELGEKKHIEYIPFPSIQDGEVDGEGKISIDNY